MRLPIFCVVTTFLACNPNIPPGGGGNPNKGLGETCGDGDRCRTALTCDLTSKTCVGSRSLANGQGCNVGPECESGYCGPNGRKGLCAEAGVLPMGSACQGDGQCAEGLKCSFDGQSLFPRC